MRCKKHPADQSSADGICASCLRERLFFVIAAQAHSQALKQAQAQKDNRKSDTDDPPPLSFPRSVSPYISRRKSDTAPTLRGHHSHHHHFFSTPQVGPTAPFAAGADKDRRKGKGRSISSLFFGIFRSKSDKSFTGPGPISDRGVSVDSCAASSSSSSSSWFSASFITGRRKKKAQAFPIDENRNVAQRRICKNRERGMSPARHSDDEDHGGSSGYSSESAHGWRQTPRKTPASAQRGGVKTAAQSKNASGLKLCLSPLVRASPNRHWSQKGLPPEMAVGGESRAPAKPYLSAAASFCKNRSRKLADFGKV